MTDGEQMFAQAHEVTSDASGYRKSPAADKLASMRTVQRQAKAAWDRWTLFFITSMLQRIRMCSDDA